MPRLLAGLPPPLQISAQLCALPAAHPPKQQGTAAAPLAQSGCVMTTCAPAARHTSAMRSSSVAITTASSVFALQACVGEWACRQAASWAALLLVPCPGTLAPPPCHSCPQSPLRYRPPARRCAGSWACPESAPVACRGSVRTGSAPAARPPVAAAAVGGSSWRRRRNSSRVYRRAAAALSTNTWIDMRAIRARCGRPEAPAAQTPSPRPLLTTLRRLLSLRSTMRASRAAPAVAVPSR